MLRERADLDILMEKRGERPDVGGKLKPEECSKSEFNEANQRGFSLSLQWLKSDSKSAGKK